MISLVHGTFGLILALLFTSTPVLAYQVNDKLAVNAIMVGTTQLQEVNSDAESPDTDRGAFVFQPEIDFSPTGNDEFFVKFGFGAGNGLNHVSPFATAPWAADLEDDVKSINGRNRDYLLTAWYKHSFHVGAAIISVTGGIIDATDYLDENAFANDEMAQFMNEALVNGPNAFFPSYDIGGAVEWEMGHWSLKGVVMGIGENDDGNSYQYYGGQLAYEFESSLGHGHYRIIVDGTSSDFINLKNGRDANRMCFLFSFDQELNKIFAVWGRFGVEDSDAPCHAKNLYSGGINISGLLWGRGQDNIGLGYAYLSNGNQDLDHTQVAEGYLRFGINDYIAISFDVQYIQDDYDGPVDPEGMVVGTRLTAEF